MTWHNWRSVCALMFVAATTGSKVVNDSGVVTCWG